jgi:citronellol/citronellal dehydrogenase
MEALFRDGLLAGQVIVTAGPCPGVGAYLEGLDALPHTLDLGDDEDVAKAAAEQTIAAAGRIDTLVVDGAAAGGPPEGIDRVWIAIRAVATLAMIESGRGGKVVILAPGPDEAAHAEATRAAFENVARTLSIEWARFNVRLTSIAPGAGEGTASVAALVAYLASPAGDYFSGSRLSLA